MRNHFQLQNYYFSTKFCAFNHIILKAKGNQRGRRVSQGVQLSQRVQLSPGGAVVPTAPTKKYAF